MRPEPRAAEVAFPPASWPGVGPDVRGSHSATGGEEGDKISSCLSARPPVQVQYLYRVCIVTLVCAARALPPGAVARRALWGACYGPCIVRWWRLRAFKANDRQVNSHAP